MTQLGRAAAVVVVVVIVVVVVVVGVVVVVVVAGQRTAAETHDTNPDPLVALVVKHWVAAVTAAGLTDVPSSVIQAWASVATRRVCVCRSAHVSGKTVRQLGREIAVVVVVVVVSAAVVVVVLVQRTAADTHDTNPDPLVALVVKHWVAAVTAAGLTEVPSSVIQA